MSSIESAVARVVVNVSDKLSHQLRTLVVRPPWTPTTQWTPAAERLLADLGADAVTLIGYVDSPDFAAVVAQFRLSANVAGTAEDQIRHGLRLAGLPERFLAPAADIVMGTLSATCERVPWQVGAHTRFAEPDLTASAAGNSRLLASLRSVTEFHAFAVHMTDQVAKLHSSIRLPHVGISRVVPHEQLYVQPSFDLDREFRFGTPGDRKVVLGDPGAGKSMLAAKLAHDVALDGSGRVPFLVVLREFTASFDEGGHDLTHYLEMLCRAPYNVKPPADSIEYLLRNGRALLVLDGLDEIVRTELRRRVTTLLEGFAHLYPLVPILVTAREIGYDEVPLDPALFEVTRILEFTPKQVRTYVHNWFALDDASFPGERKRLATSFMEDSERIPELRSNPLLLSLLCAMYSSDRYLPRNLAQAYERCALMLFEHWDARREILLPLRFQGKVRGAVQHLAWTMLTEPESGRAQSRTRIVQALTRYLEPKLDDHDESVATAEQFLAYCTGRAWVLTDVGATGAEPRFGFTHRTFLEYFAAEHLVRTNRTAASLWAALEPNIGQWEVVAQIALQLHDRNVEGGVDELLGEALTDTGLDFAVRSLHHTHPSNRTIRAIAEAALDRSVFHPIDGVRMTMGPAATTSADQPIMSLLHDSTPANFRVVEQAVVTRLDALLERGEPGAALVLEHLVEPPEESGVRALPELYRAVAPKHGPILARLHRTPPWAGSKALADPDALCQIVERFGVEPLYLRVHFHRTSRFSAASQLLEKDELLIPRREGDRLAVVMATRPTPWFGEARFRTADVTDLRTARRTSSLWLMLSLPRLERASRMGLVGSARSSRAEVLTWLRQLPLPPEVHAFLRDWLAGGISVLERDPQPPPPPRAPR
ncbi:NACHT domain-containing protein [Lentzea sp. NPDC060358]|uniref:NACHT domain-containing protein n=1 Tax=Lentzea sp. NPDC060358 TaxID=3347103 RepID=UPI003661744B